ncbi:MAG: hypothetical protein US52_C0019G0002 [candidate division WS6 bacterium GW2011_GWA2_37_6]|uniref:Uncharacterized protein n=1 Tax=candidate division WS6 bacterium GW2011_GWA2_37_6 TaxID=1619087 RepID=A0A0G0HAW6_9BACT|nr:MAG: hypothetical protein US52_C0019G0002 [candidate division WS6 bacterium GW2011_GWA2_37_6]
MPFLDTSTEQGLRDYTDQRTQYIRDAALNAAQKAHREISDREMTMERIFNDIERLCRKDNPETRAQMYQDREALSLLAEWTSIGYDLQFRPITDGNYEERDGLRHRVGSNHVFENIRDNTLQLRLCYPNTLQIADLQKKELGFPDIAVISVVDPANG